jgi:hypothetical protein
MKPLFEMKFNDGSKITLYPPPKDGSGYVLTIDTTYDICGAELSPWELQAFTDRIMSCCSPQKK